MNFKVFLLLCLAVAVAVGWRVGRVAARYFVPRWIMVVGVIVGGCLFVVGQADHELDRHYWALSLVGFGLMTCGPAYSFGSRRMRRSRSVDGFDPKRLERR